MNPKFITVHCSATNPDTRTTVGDIRRMHVEGNGWSDIGYHFYIDQEGNLFVGRPLTRTGAHTKGHNKDNIGICLEGGVNAHVKPENNFTEAQMSSLRELITEMASRYGIKEEDIKGHRDWFGDTNGDGVIDAMDWLKECPCFDVRSVFKSWGE